MIEVEVKLKVDDLDDIARKLDSCGYILGTVLEEEDIYFNAPDRDFRQTDEALRIRRESILQVANSNILSTDGISEKVFVTYKGKKLDSISMARKELETQISDFDTMNQIFLSLGYIPTIPVKKIRKIYQKDNISVCADIVDGLGDFIEIEVCVDDETYREEALEIIQEELASLGYSIEETTRTSYLSMLESKKSNNKICN